MFHSQLTKQMKYLIVDDELPSQDVIINYARAFDFLELAHQSYKAIDAMKWLKKNTTDLIFLDIKTLKITGISMLKLLNNKPEVIISSAYEEYDLESYELNVADYFLKPYSLDRFYSAIQRVKKNSSQRKKKRKKQTHFLLKLTKNIIN
jgi:two-component system response regulator LytT